MQNLASFYEVLQQLKRPEIYRNTIPAFLNMQKSFTN